jgi:osmotically-inducible protein OsmY
MRNITSRRIAWVVGALLCIAVTIACGGRSVTATVDDGTITTRVKTALLNDPEVDGTSIDVSTSQGVVMLSGRVKSAEEAERARAVAQRIPGVKRVDSTLQAPPGGAD